MVWFTWTKTNMAKFYVFNVTKLMEVFTLPNDTIGRNIVGPILVLNAKFVIRFLAMNVALETITELFIMFLNLL